ncbi:MAG: cupin domain-containing protein [Candidatus Bathyarchaeota archaeon]|nr:cupin domain-containing protein [Candidatus Bathyarchaeota archaeon]
MDDFPAFMKNPQNQVPAQNQYSDGIEGYYYTANNGAQIAFWTAHTEGTSKTHSHPYDEYVVCIQGKYTLLIGNREIDLLPGDEYHIPKDTPHACKRTAGTRTIHAFGGQRIQK